MKGFAILILAVRGYYDEMLYVVYDACLSELDLVLSVTVLFVKTRTTMTDFPRSRILSEEMSKT